MTNIEISKKLKITQKTIRKSIKYLNQNLSITKLSDSN